MAEKQETVCEPVQGLIKDTKTYRMQDTGGSFNTPSLPERK